MKTKDLAAIKSLFDMCEPLSTEERIKLLEQAPYSSQVIKEVKKLLTISEQEDSDTHNTIINKQVKDMSQQLNKGQLIGFYQIDDEIGRGGMGIVFLAHRADGSYKQKVAIKISPSFANEEEIRRFNFERQLLAKLQHPNIAMLLDGGTTQDQRPYLVMEYIDGENISTYCEQNKLNLEQRLALFIEVTNAVIYAHSHSIIHRDIKADNILVNSEGRVKLLDFGVSKALQDDEIDLTNTIQKGLTVDYSSPEQVKGETTTTATDVYSLGALLYQLVTGQSPHKIKKKSPEEIINAVCLVTPDLASKTAKVGAIKAADISSDLDNIIAKALRKSPINRYGSVNELKLDIERYLKNEPVIATPSSFIYRTKKVIKRYPIPSLLSAALALSLVVGLITSLNLTKQLSLEKDKLTLSESNLKKEVATSEEVITLLTDMFKAAAPENAKGKSVSVNNLLEAAVEKTNNSLSEQITIKEKLLRVLSNVHSAVGLDSKALTLLNQSLDLKSKQNKTISIQEQILLANYHIRANQFEKAEQNFLAAEKRLNDTTSEIDKINLYKELSDFYSGSKVDKEKAFNYLQKALAIPFPDSPNESQLETQLGLQQVLATHYSDIQEREKAIELYEGVVEKRKQFYGEDHPNNINALSNLADLYRRHNQIDKYEQAIKQSYTLSEKYYDPNRNDYYYNVITYAVLLADGGYPKQAIEVYNKELSKNITNQQSLALYLTYRASSYIRIGNYSKALQDLLRSTEIQNSLYDGSNIRFTFTTQLHLGLMLAADKQFIKSAQVLTNLHDEATKLWGQDGMPIAGIYITQAHSYVFERKFDLALELLTKAEAILSAHAPKNSPPFQEVYLVYIDLYLEQQNWQQLIHYADKSIEISDKAGIIKSLTLIKKSLALKETGNAKTALNLFDSNKNILINKIDSTSAYQDLIDKIELTIKQNH